MSVSCTALQVTKHVGVSRFIESLQDKLFLLNIVDSDTILSSAAANVREAEDVLKTV